MGRLIKTGLLLSLTLLSLQGLASDNTRHNDENQAQALQLLKAGKILPLERILEITRKELGGNILEVELEQSKKLPNTPYIYELEILNDKGQVWEIKIDAQTGDIIEREQE